MKTFLVLFVFIWTISCNSKTPAVATPEDSAGNVINKETGKVENKDTMKDEPVIPKVNGPQTGSIPSCIQAKIDSLKTMPVKNPPAQVDEYSYNGARVYGFSLGCCDMFYEVYSSECNYICAPSGGFTGKGDGKCKDFEQQAKLIRVVWKDERARK